MWWSAPPIEIYQKGWGGARMPPHPLAPTARDRGMQNFFFIRRKKKAYQSFGLEKNSIDIEILLIIILLLKLVMFSNF